ncbi:hypothetical protein SAMN05444921_10549 [Streptomyces wuyuanensis]|uniref:Uncharacterized protein n=1 Tax=Streptomyces wuyuanensis TaxID=1196353 RepID=A0A1G9R7V1_9ACTN|nr:hypothetical protein SAMN05444921_10549 [Streptomyces wuyuanensis]
MRREGLRASRAKRGTAGGWSAASMIPRAPASGHPLTAPPSVKPPPSRRAISTYRTSTGSE